MKYYIHCLNCNSFSCYRGIVVEGSYIVSQKIDDLSVLVIFRSGT